MSGSSAPSLSPFAAARSSPTSLERSSGPARTLSSSPTCTWRRARRTRPAACSLPPYDTCETLERLAEVIDRFEPTTVICLGDSLHDVAAAERIPDECLESLEILQEDREWIWLTGNHDRKIGEALGGTVLEIVRVAGLTLRHEPRALPVTHEIAGHLHPAAKLSFYGHTIRRPCFVGNGLRLVLPAFGTYTGGLNVLDGAFEPLFGSDGFAVWVLGQEGLYPVATRLLRDD